jgi:hypothetical protein
MSTPSSSVPSINWLPSGPVVPAESDILDGVLADTNAAFGGNMNTTNRSVPQGQLAQSTAAIIGAKNDDMLEVVNGVDPDRAAGRWQDAIGRIYFIDRDPAESTAVIATCSGAGVTIPVGARAKATDGNVYICTQEGTIPPSGGSIDLTFACVTTGPIACPAGSLAKIFQAINGWDSITNVDDGVIGSNVESRADFENRRRQSVALNSKGAVPSVRGAVLSVANILDAYVTDNGLPTPVTIRGVVVAANSLYVCAAGGAAQDIANAIWTKKSPGCNYNGDTTITVNDTDGYTPPYPSFQVSFQTAIPLPILLDIQIANVSMLPANVITLIQSAVIAAFSGADGGQRMRIGRAIFASRFYGPVSGVDPSVEIISIFIGTTTANQNSIGVNINCMPTISASNISVTLV